MTSLRGRGLMSGVAEGSALVSARNFTFAHGVDPATGIVTDVRSDIKGSAVKGKVLCYPFGKGSTTASSWFIEAVRCGNSPAALVTDGVDLSAVIGSVLARLIYKKSIPVVSGVPASLLSGLPRDAVLSVDGGTGEVVVKN